MAPPLVMAWIQTGFTLLWNDKGPPAPHTLLNHASASQHHAFVTQAILDLLATGAAEAWHGPARPHCVSPLGVVTKPGSDKKRLILDLRVTNASLVIPPFKYESLSAVPDTLRQNDYMFTTDLASGYHHVDMHANYHTYLGFHWMGQYYVFTSLPFGLASACWAFTKITRTVLRHWRADGLRCLGYLDDCIFGNACRLVLAAQLNRVLHDFDSAGFLLKWLKCNLELLQQQPFLGMIIDTLANCFRVPDNKRIAVLTLCLNVLRSVDQACKARPLASLAGQLVAMSWAFGKMSIVMTRGMFDVLSGVTDMNSRVSLSQSCLSELQFWHDSFVSFNGHCSIWRPTLVNSITMHTDAAGRSATALGGWAGVVRIPHVTEPLIAHGIFTELEACESSTYQELLAIWHALVSLHSMFSTQGVQGQAVLVMCDNQGACQILGKGSSCNARLHSICLEIYWFCLRQDIFLSACWLPRELNVEADFYSKFNDGADLMLNPRLFQVIQQRWGRFDVDLFASHSNHHVPSYYSLFHTPSTSGVNAFCYHWSGHCWCHPPHLFDCGCAAPRKSMRRALVPGYSMVDRCTMVAKPGVRGT